MWRRNMLSYASSYFDLNDIFEGTSSSLPSSNYVIESSSRYSYHPKWQAPLGYLLYLFVLLIYTIGEKIILTAHQLYKSLFSCEITFEDIAYMTEEKDEPKSAKRQTTVNSFLACSIRILRFIMYSRFWSL
jgi:hypothetical protein